MTPALPQSFGPRSWVQYKHRMGGSVNHGLTSLSESFTAPYPITSNDREQTGDH
jgi:hypothetical protein